MRAMSPGTPQSGMALLIVLWVVAGLSLFAASLGRTVRSEAKQASVARYMVQGRAYGEAAINLTLAQLKSNTSVATSYTVQKQEWDGIFVEVEIVPAQGLVNINTADALTLATLLEKAAGLSRAQAQQLAEAVVAQRTVELQQGSAWETLEDVLQVPGMNYFIFEAIRPFVLAQRWGDAAVSLSAAPEPLRTWLTAAGVGQSYETSSALLRLTAQVVFPSEGQVLVVRKVSLREDQRRGLPWKVLAAEQRWQAAPKMAGQSE